MSGKWTPGQKRTGGVAGVARSVEIVADVFQELKSGAIPPRSGEEIRLAAGWFAHGAVQCGEDPALYLGMMGLDRAGLDEDKAHREPCWPYAGTLRGYNIHLRSYTRCCGACAGIRDEMTGRVRARFGITHDGVVA